VKILDIYEKYNIMPQLMEHQLRVAAAADLICENLEIEIDQDNIVKACLLHDMGNIVKFDFTLLPEVVVQKGQEYWEGVKKEFEQKYGANTHEVTSKIIQEMGVSNRVLELADSVGFSEAFQNMQSNDFGKKICHYADARVGPYGVITLEERLMDLRERYENKGRSLAKNPEEREGFENALREMEKQIFAKCKIQPKDITDESIKLKLEKLRNWEIHPALI
jgi:hypothetical protein